MTVATGYRPRPWEDHLRLATALAHAPARVAIDHADDGWVAAHLAVCGRAPVWASAADPHPAERALVRLGLPRLSGGTTHVRVGWDLRLKGRGRPQRVPGTAGWDVDIVTSVSGGYTRVRDHVRTLAGQGRLLVADRSGDDRIASLLDRVPGARVVPCAGVPEAEALALACRSAGGQAVLVVPEASLMLPGGLAVLHHAWGREEAPCISIGDVVLLDEQGARPVGLGLAPRLPAELGGAIARLSRAVPRPALLHRSLVEGWLTGEIGRARVLVSPVWTSGLVGSPNRNTAQQRRPGLALVPEDQGLFVIVDDGDEGALGQTLASLPDGARTAVLRAVPDACDGAIPRDHILYGGFGDLGRVPTDEPWSLRLTSDPTWEPPALHAISLLQTCPCPVPSAVVAVAAVQGWERPLRRRAVGHDRLAPLARLAVDAREAAEQGDPRLAFTLGKAMLGAAPDWLGGPSFLDAIEMRQAG